MSLYVPVGISDEDLAFQAESGGGITPFNPMTGLFDLIAQTGLDIDNALNAPEVRAFMQKTGIKVEQVKVEEKRRKQKGNLLLWGGAAAFVAFLVLRKKS